MKVLAALFALLFATSAQASVFEATKPFASTLEFALPVPETINYVAADLLDFGPSAYGFNIIADFSFSLYSGQTLVGYAPFSSYSIATGCACGPIRKFVSEIAVDRVVFEYWGETPSQEAKVQVELGTMPLQPIPLPASGLLLIGGLALLRLRKR